MNMKRVFFRLALVLSLAWTGGYFVTASNPREELWMGLGGGIFIWVCYWIIAGFFKDKTETRKAG